MPLAAKVLRPVERLSLAPLWGVVWCLCAPAAVGVLSRPVTPCWEWFNVQNSFLSFRLYSPRVCQKIAYTGLPTPEGNRLKRTHKDVKEGAGKGEHCS